MGSLGCFFSFGGREVIGGLGWTWCLYFTFGLRLEKGYAFRCKGGSGFRSCSVVGVVLPVC